MRLARKLVLILVKPTRPTFLLSMLLLAGILRLAVASYISDDAYISFTYARNYALGLGLVFNPGEHVYGFTNPGWTVLASWFFRVFPEQQAIMGIKVLALVVSLATTVLLYYVVQKEVNETVARLIVLLWVLQPWDIAEAMNGLETPVYAFLLLISLHFFLRDRWWWGCWGLGVATLMRPEAALLFLFMLGYRLIKYRQRGLASAASGVLAFGLAVLPWYVYALSVYHTPIPNSFYEKANPALASLRQIITQSVLVCVSYLPVYFIIGWGLFVLKIKRLRSGIMIVFICWSALMMLYYVAIPSFVRYFVGPGLIALCCSAGTLSPWVEHVTLKRPDERKFLWSGVTLAVVYLVVWGVLGSLSNLYFYNLTAEGFKNIHVYTAKWIAENVPSRAVVAAHDVGALGFYSHHYILDTTSLVSGQDRNAFPSDQTWLQNKKPDYLFVSQTWVGSFPSTIGCGLTEILNRQGRISYRTPDANFILYHCDWP